MDKHAIRTNGLNQLITFLKSNLEGQTETEYKVKMEDRLGSVNLRKVSSYPSTRFLNYLVKELSEINDAEEFSELFNNALKYTVTHLGFSGNEELIEEFIEKVEDNYIAEKFEVDTKFVLGEFAELDLHPKGVENYSYLKVIPILDEEEIGKFELDPPFICPVLPIQIKCRYKGREVSKVFESSGTKDFNFSKNRRAGLEIDNVEKILNNSDEDETESEKSEEGESEESDSKEVYVCENCGDEFLSKTKLEEHLKAQKTVKERNRDVEESGGRAEAEEESADNSEEEKNSNRVLNRKSIALMAVIAISVAIFSGFSDSPSEEPVAPLEGVNASDTELPPVEKLDFNQLEDDIVTQINQVRSERNLSNLSHSTKLSEIASRHAESITDRKNLTHFSRDGLNTTERFREAGYICTNMDVGENFNGGENIYSTTYGFTGEFTQNALNTSEELSQDIVNGLLEGEDTRDLLLDPDLNFQGVGVHGEKAEGSEARKIYAVQDVC